VPDGLVLLSSNLRTRPLPRRPPGLRLGTTTPPAPYRHPAVGHSVGVPDVSPDRHADQRCNPRKLWVAELAGPCRVQKHRQTGQTAQSLKKAWHSRFSRMCPDPFFLIHNDQHPRSTSLNVTSTEAWSISLDRFRPDGAPYRHHSVISREEGWASDRPGCRCSSNSHEFRTARRASRPCDGRLGPW
jgi:hypothetical protein